MTPRKLRVPTREHLLDENASLRTQLAETEAALNTLRASRAETPPVQSNDGAPGVQLASVSERQRAEQALRQEEARYRAFFEQATVGMARIGPDGHWLEVNQKLCALTGHSREDLLTLSLGDILHADDRPAVLAAFGKLLAGEQHGTPMETRFVRKDGGTVCAEITASVVRGQGAQPQYVAVLANDVTPRKRAEQQLLESQRFSEKVLQSSLSGLYVYDLERGTNVFVNDRYTALTGYTLDDLAGMDEAEYAALLHPADRQHVLAQLRTVKDAPETETPEMEYRLRTADDRWIWCRARHVVAERRPDGSPRQVVGSFLDITEHKEAQERLGQVVARFEAIIASMPDAVIFADVQRQIISVNPAFTALFGYTRGQAVGENAGLIYAEKTDFEEQGRLHYSADGRPDPTPFDLRYRRKDGSTFWAETRAMPVRDGHGALLGFVAIHRDITERKRNEEALRDRTRRLELLSRTAAQLLASGDPQRLVETLCREVMQYLDCHVFFNFLAVPPSPGGRGPGGGGDEQQGKLRLNACAGIPAETARSIEWLNFGVAVCGCVARDGKRIVAENIAAGTDPRTDLVRGFGVQAYACHPLLGAQGRVLGTLSFGTKTRAQFRADELELMRAVTDLVAMAMHRIRTEEALRRAKDEWERTFDAVPDLIAILDTEHRVVRANQAMAKRLGVTPGQCMGLKCYQCVHGTDAPPAVCPHVETLKDGQTHCAELREPRLNGDYLVTTTPLLDEQGRMAGSVHVARDITARKRAEDELRKVNRTLKALSNASQAQVRSETEAAFLEAACRIVVEDCGHAMVWVGFAENDEAKSVRPVASAGFEASYLETVQLTWADTERGRGPTGTAIRTGKPCKCANILTDPRFAPWREEARKRGYASSLVLPLREGERVFGAVSIYSREADAFSDEETKLLAELADDLAFGLAALRTRAALRQLNTELERRVAEQTAAIQQGYEAAKLERQRLYDVLETLPVYVVLLSNDYHVPFANRFFRERFGESPGRCCFDYLFKRTEPCENCESYKALATNAPHHWEWTGPDGHNYDLYDFPFKDADGSQMILEMGIDITAVKQAQAALKEANETLEKRVAERTAQLSESNAELARFNEAMVGRELRIIELKKEVNAACTQAGQAPRYKLDFENGH
jgi:PAS domain S-box-containing protein